MDSQQNLINLPSRITIYPHQDKAIDHVLSEFLERCPAQLVILSEISGQLVSAAGARGNFDLVALSSLVAGNMAASQEVARLLHEYQKGQLVMREGPTTNTLIAEVGEYLFLFAMISKDVPLGWARLLINEVSRQLLVILTTPSEKMEGLSLGITQENVEQWVDSALDSIWPE